MGLTDKTKTGEEKDFPVPVNQAGKDLKKGKKKQELDRQKRRRLEKALANSAAIISALEKKKQRKREEQEMLDEEVASIADAVALHVRIGEGSGESRCSDWDPDAGFNLCMEM
ncbi:hypothetical protein ACQJBY_035483 [Aegilops geniculata]